MHNKKTTAAVLIAGILVGLGVTVLVVFTVRLPERNPLSEPAVDNGREADLFGTPRQQGVFLHDQSQLVDWFNRTDLRHKSQGVFKALQDWKTTSRKLLIPCHNGDELSSDIVIIPETDYEASGIYYRHYAEDITCIVQVYPAATENPQDIADDPCAYRFGKKLTGPPQEGVNGHITLNGKEVHYGLSYSESMERNFFTFLYADRYIVTIGYMDGSTVDLFDFMRNFGLKEIPLS